MGILSCLVSFLVFCSASAVCDIKDWIGTEFHDLCSQGLATISLDTTFLGLPLMPISAPVRECVAEWWVGWVTGQGKAQGLAPQWLTVTLGDPPFSIICFPPPKKGNTSPTFLPTCCNDEEKAGSSHNLIKAVPKTIEENYEGVKLLSCKVLFLFIFYF